MDKERWRYIPGFPNHAISSRGRIIALGRDVIRRDGVVTHYRSKLLGLSKSGRVTIGTNAEVHLLDVRDLFKLAWGYDLPIRSWPMKGRYLE